MELEELIENLDLEEMNYFYHITGKGYGDDIINEGLFLLEKELRTTTIPLPIEFLKNPQEYCESEYTTTLVKREEMVIIGCEKGEEKYIVEKLDDSKWIGNQKFDYMVSNRYILGYIDLETFEVTYNYEYEYGGRHV